MTLDIRALKDCLSRQVNLAQLGLFLTAVEPELPRLILPEGYRLLLMIQVQVDFKFEFESRFHPIPTDSSTCVQKFLIGLSVE